MSVMFHLTVGVMMQMNANELLTGLEDLLDIVTCLENVKSATCVGHQVGGSKGRQVTEEEI